MYIMEDSREAARLAAKVNASEWVSKYLQQYLPPSGSILEVGCGPGVLLRSAAQANPALRLTGIDISADRVREATERNADLPHIEILQGDASCALHVPADSFDVVYSRFMLEYLADKDRVVHELSRVCRPGGAVLLQDLDGQLVWHYPEDEELERQVGEVLRALAKTGFDPFVGRKLFSLAHRAGLADIHVQVEGYHLIAGAVDPVNRRHWALKLDIAKPVIAQALCSETAARQLVRRFLEYLDRPDTLTYSTLFTVTARKPL